MVAIVGFTIVCVGPQMGTSVQNSWQLLVIDIAAGGLLVSVISPGRVSQIFSGKIIVYLGKISFGLYVYHEFAIRVIATGPNTTKILGQNWASYSIDLIAALGLTVILGAISYRWYERPILKLKARYETIASRPA